MPAGGAVSNPSQVPARRAVSRDSIARGACHTGRTSSSPPARPASTNSIPVSAGSSCTGPTQSSCSTRSRSKDSPRPLTGRWVRVSVIAQKNTAPLGGGKSVISGAVHATKVSGSFSGPKQERGEGSGPAHNTGKAMQETSLGNMSRANLAARRRGALISINRLTKEQKKNTLAGANRFLSRCHPHPSLNRTPTS